MLLVPRLHLNWLHYLKEGGESSVRCLTGGLDEYASHVANNVNDVMAASCFASEHKEQ